MLISIRKPSFVSFRKGILAKWKADVNSRAIEVSILLEVKAGRVFIRSSKVGNEIPGTGKLIRLQRGMPKCYELTKDPWSLGLALG